MRKETEVYIPFVVSITKNIVGMLSGVPDTLPFLQLEQKLIQKHDYDIERKGKIVRVIFRGLKVPAEGLVGGQIGLEKDIQLHVDDGEVISNQQSVDWPWVRFFWLREGQQILIQRSFVNKFGMQIAPFAKLLSKVFEKALGGKYYVNVRTLPEEGEFWRVLEGSENVYYIEFNYVAPNIAGATAQHVKGLLDHFKEKLNSTESTIRICNKDGALEWERGDEYLDAAISTVEKTGGGWKVRNERGTLASRQVIKQMTVEEIGAFCGEEVLRQVLSNVKKD